MNTPELDLNEVVKGWHQPDLKREWPEIGRRVNSLSLEALRALKLAVDCELKRRTCDPVILPLPKDHNFMLPIVHERGIDE